MKYSQKTLHSSPERARYGVSFVSSKGNILCRLVKIELYKIFAIINRAIKGLHCTIICQWDLDRGLKGVYNTLRPRQNGHHFADDIFKCILLNENAWISIKISLKFVLEGLIDNIPALIQIMARHRPGDKPLSEAMMVRLPTHVYVTQPQWVNTCKHRFMIFLSPSSAQSTVCNTMFYWAMFSLAIMRLVCLDWSHYILVQYTHIVHTAHQWHSGRFNRWHLGRVIDINQTWGGVTKPISSVPLFSRFFQHCQTTR